MSSTTILHFAERVTRENEIKVMISLIDNLLDMMCICELTNEGRIVLKKVKQELKNKL